MHVSYNNIVFQSDDELVMCRAKLASTEHAYLRICVYAASNKMCMHRCLGRGVQAPQADVLSLGAVPEEAEGEEEADAEELEEVIEAAKQSKRMLAERNASLQNKVHQVSTSSPCFAACPALHCTALHCTALHCTALHCTALHCTALHCS